MTVLGLIQSKVDMLPKTEKAAYYFDDKLTGFGLWVAPPSRRHPTGKRSWFIEYRPGEGGRGVTKRRMVIGDTTTLSATAARKKAKVLLGKVVNGTDPAKERADARSGETVEKLLRTYLDHEIKPKRKPRTLELYEGYLKNHIAPRSEDGERAAHGALGSKKAISVTRADVARLHRQIGERQPATANRVIKLLSAAFAWAAKHELTKADHPNPARSVALFPETPRERFLSTEEFARLGETLRLAETTGLPWEPDPAKKVKHAPKPDNRVVKLDRWTVAAVRLLVFTGCRLREILNLRWTEVDLERGLLLLRDSKTGAKAVVLSSPALEILKQLAALRKRLGLGEYVVASTDMSKARADLQRPWAQITKHARLDGLRIHDLRHSFASVGAAGGLGLPIVGKLLGHKDASTTQRYAHLADDPLRRGANAIATHIQSALAGRPKKKSGR
jgi:integrase